MFPALTPRQRILGIGCGSGTQTLDLARATPAAIVAVDNHPEAFNSWTTKMWETGR